jgi:hypothetical protein
MERASGGHRPRTAATCYEICDLVSGRQSANAL